MAARSKSPASPAEHTEAEVTLDVPERWTVPDLGVVLATCGVTQITEPVTHELDARYLDTADLRLLQAKATLRRRSGGSDAGWHLKLPRPDGDRTEVTMPLRGPSVHPPRELSALLRGTLRGERLTTAARLRTSRTVRLLLGAAGEDGAPVVLAELADDSVTATAPGRAPGQPEEVTTWRELEVELVDGDRQVLDAAVDALVLAGALRSSSPSKLRRVLGDRLPPPAPAPAPLTGKSRADAVLGAFLRGQVEQLVAEDLPVRRRQPDAVHQMRVASRRLRSALATFRPLLAREETDPLRQELSWLAGALGGARDAEVTREHLLHQLRSAPDQAAAALVAQRLGAALDAEEAAGDAVATAALDDPRYLRLLASLDALAASPPMLPEAAGRAKDLLLRRVARDHQRLAEALDVADGARDRESRAELLHEARKAAKRARYAAQALAPVFGADASRYASAVQAVQEALGAVQDSVHTRAVLLAAAHDAPSAEAFVLGRLHALEEVRAQDGEAAAEQAWHVASRRKLRRWLG